MNVKVNYSYVRAIDRQFVNGFSGNTLVSGTNLLAGTDGYTSSFFKWGDQTYYQDFDITLSRRLSKEFKLNLMYMNQLYNISQIQQHVGGLVHCDIFVADGLYQFSPKTRLRVEAQYLSTKKDEGDWLFGLAELSLAPHWMFTLSDMWNCGDSDLTMRERNTHYHYYQALVTYNIGSHRLQAGYGRTREGINCSGGVCRRIPAQKGFTLSYNYNF
jgi:predicted porin